MDLAHQQAGDTFRPPISTPPALQTLWLHSKSLLNQTSGTGGLPPVGAVPAAPWRCPQEGRSGQSSGLAWGWGPGAATAFPPTHRQR